MLRNCIIVSQRSLVASRFIWNHSVAEGIGYRSTTHDDKGKENNSYSNPSALAYGVPFSLHPSHLVVGLTP
jgi:hypothetical protein